MTNFPATDPKTRLYVGAIALTLLTCGLAFVAWGHDNSWQLSGLSTYQVFPIFGLLAFSIMWSQYVVEAVMHYLELPSIRPFFARTSLLVLVAILLHPGLLIAQRYHDGYGLPPGSYETYVAPMQKWIVILGSLSLLMFLAFEFKRFFGDRSWWKYVIALNDVAIVAIFYHGLRLGQDLQASSWYQIVWYAYGIVLLPVLLYKYYYKFQLRRVRQTA